MSRPQPPVPAKLVVSLLMHEQALVVPVARALERSFGSIDLASAWLSFTYTRYYDREMGSPLWRRMFALRKLIQQDELPAIKLATNRLEEHWRQDGRRRVNIDPGYLLQERFVLATGKNFTHRLYLNRGIYADLTLIYTRGAFQALPWTYPDYADVPLTRFLHEVRRKHAVDLTALTRCAEGAAEPAGRNDRCSSA